MALSMVASPRLIRCRWSYVCNRFNSRPADEEEEEKKQERQQTEEEEAKEEEEEEDSHLKSLPEGSHYLSERSLAGGG